MNEVYNVLHFMHSTHSFSYVVKEGRGYQVRMLNDTPVNTTSYNYYLLLVFCCSLFEVSTAAHLVHIFDITHVLRCMSFLTQPSHFYPGLGPAPRVTLPWMGYLPAQESNLGCWTQEEYK